MLRTCAASTGSRSITVFYAWKAKFVGFFFFFFRRLKQLEGENAKLKNLLAEAMLDVAVSKDITSRKW